VDFYALAQLSITKLILASVFVGAADGSDPTNVVDLYCAHIATRELSERESFGVYFGEGVPRQTMSRSPPPSLPPSHRNRTLHTASPACGSHGQVQWRTWPLIDWLKRVCVAHQRGETGGLCVSPGRCTGTVRPDSPNLQDECRWAKQGSVALLRRASQH